MAISATSITSPTNPAQGASGTQTLGQDQFLQLFVKQLQYQNPLNPMDASAFTSQLAQFSSLEQLTNLNTQMKTLLVYQNSLQNTLTINLIGKQVKIAGDSISLKNNKADVNFTLSKDASKVTISIYNSSGSLVRTIDAGQHAAGDNSYQWDGKDSNGNILPDGQYQVKVEASDSSGNPVGAATTSYGTVTGITYENNTTYLVVNGTIKVLLSDIKEIIGGA